MYAHSLIAALLKPEGFRFVLHPEETQDFPDARPLERLTAERLTVHKDAQGTILARKRDVKLYLDPVTGSFTLNLASDQQLSGIMQMGKFGPPHFLLRLTAGDQVYGFGAADGALKKNGSTFQLKTIDTLFYSIKGSSYSAFPFFVIRRGTDFFGVYLNSTLPINVRIDGEGSARAEGPEIYFEIQSPVPTPIDVFVYHGTLADVLSAYCRTTGMPFLPPAWALGFHQSRWSYRTQERVIQLSERFRKEEIPCDAIHLDIHYMEKYRVFTWNKKFFPDPAGMHDALDKMGMRTVAIVDPGVAAVEDYETYDSGRKEDAFVRDSMGNNYKGKVWPGVTVFPDFTKENVRNWWAHQHAPLFRMGVSGIWNDMNEPTWKMGKKDDPLLEDLKFQNYAQYEIRNIYANLEAEATGLAFQKYKAKDRPFVLTRSAFCGIQKHACMWTGDNSSSWDQLKENLNMVLNLAMTGVPFSGSDVGGFGGSKGLLGVFKFRRDAELFARWMELGSLMPFFRAHTVLYSRDQEPWSFGEEVLAISRKHIKRRYRLFWYLYSLFHKANSAGESIVRPVFYDFPDVASESCTDLFMLGPALLAAPILEKSQHTRSVRLPENGGGGWCEFETGETYAPGMHQFATKPGYFPLFIRGGSVIPLSVPGRNIEDTMKTPLTIEVVPGPKIEGKVILDDGRSNDGRCAVLTVSGKQDRNGSVQLQIDYREEGFSPFQKTVRLRMPRGFRTAVLSKSKRIEATVVDLVREDRLGTVMEFELPLEDAKIELEYRTP